MSGLPDRIYVSIEDGHIGIAKFGFHDAIFVHESLLTRDAERVRELEMRLKQTQEWRDYYRRMWLGSSVSELPTPITDAELETVIAYRLRGTPDKP